MNVLRTVYLISALLYPLLVEAAGPVIKIDKVERTINAILITGTVDVVPVGTKFSARVLSINGKRLNDPARMIIAATEKIQVASDRRLEVKLQRYGSLDAFDFPPGKYEVEFSAHFNSAWQSQDVLKEAGVAVDEQGRTDLAADPRKLPQSPDLKKERAIGGGMHRVLEAIRVVSVGPVNAPQAFGKTTKIRIEVHDTSAAARRNPVRTIAADNLLQRDVLQAVGPVSPSQAIVLSCVGPFPAGYIAADLYFSGGRINRETAGEHATTLKEACHRLELRCRAC